MNKQPLHITNGSVLTDILNELKIEGDFLTWQAMLCEGPTIENVFSEEFLKLRRAYFKDFYNVEVDNELIHNELDKLDYPERYSEIVLWFEYDLFCHINMVAVISLIKQKKIDLPIYLVSSGREKGSKNLIGLGELNSEQLVQHYKSKVLLNADDLDMARNVWSIYCGVDHNLLKPLIVKSSSFDYLSNCLKAHLERFPDSVTGLNDLERNILEILNKHKVTSKNHLLGYILNYQGYFGYGDFQLKRIIDELSVFYTVKEDHLELNRKGLLALQDQHNFAEEIENGMTYGGVKKAAFYFSKSANKLIKSVHYDD
ncbi:DUF1835 domain-containing protein [Tamlana sp. 2_MG-2023]|uniref:DUF1835 domain-containing protein n=1 Tax=unclassified Tamlana TaxID=2614803 RepID=UPI0026E43A74|nr:MULTISPECIES: DUF1835 domain-containing protein [unclassified Tamlana]MDO6759530.1 DUF1835 domain-containing protein [Tamlana sp. 2_MG-2023]MDO6790331.1 DUF1835 domain-containing protein [Tamlana sp. 1_MG-2023]